MALFEGEEETVEEENSYLTNLDKGIELVRTLISAEADDESAFGFDIMLQDELFPLVAELELQNEVEIYRALQKLSDRLKEQKKIKILEGKKIVGIGGKFSSGKSCFINSITNAKLPEGQKPTTSIATYIVNSDYAKNIAITNNDRCVEIDDEAVEALAHSFYEKYNIGFSKLLKNLVIYTPDFTYPNIAILDTPGYSKSDISKSDDSSDAEIAREQLKSVDYLIWLVDANQGTITQRDLDFMNSLNVKNDILVVFTKASQKTKADLEMIIDEAKRTLMNAGRNIFDVIAYDSLSKEEIIGVGSLNSFFEMVNGGMNNSNMPEKQLEKIKYQLDSQLQESINKLKICDEETSNILSETTNVEHIGSIISEYVRNKTYLAVVSKHSAAIKICMDKLISFYNSEIW